jgi:hypothetical protein
MTSATTSKAIPYEEHEVINGVVAPAALNNNNDNNNNNNAALHPPQDDDDADASFSRNNIAPAPFAPFALIPLHPASNVKQKQPALQLESKQIPVVLGRTNLAKWWWKSCPCQNYCRLYCRPVAQNIRSLSKVMIQLDTFGKLHIVGKNPHLITLTPPRLPNERLQVQDIVSIGRRDREPWMRFQVVGISTQQPQQQQQQRARRGEQTPIRSTKPRPPEWSGDTHKSKNSNRKTNSPPPTFVAAAAAQAAADAAAAEAALADCKKPPEWITTTRKRKSSSAAAATANISRAGTHAPATKQQGAPLIAEVATAAAEACENLNHAFQIAANNGGGVQDGNLNNPPPCKRRRRDNNATMNGDKDTKPKSSKSRRNKRGGGDVGAPANSSDTGPDAPPHRHVHLLFQDYETSAALVLGTQRSRRQPKHTMSCNSSFSSTTPDTSTGANNNTSTNNNNNKRTLVAAKSQLRLLSRNFAAALLGKGAAVPPNNDNDDKNENGSQPQLPPPPPPPPRESSSSHKPSASTTDVGGAQEEAESKRNAESALTQPQPHDHDTQQSRMAQQPMKNNYHNSPACHLPHDETNELQVRASVDDNSNNATGGAFSPTLLQETGGPPETMRHASEAGGFSLNSNAAMTQQQAQEQQVERSMQQVELSMLSMPQCSSGSFEQGESFEPGQPEYVDMPPPASKSSNGNSASTAAKSSISDASECSPETRDPVTDLGPWQDMVHQEKPKDGDTVTSFRHALASLVVAKNQGEQQQQQQQQPQGGLLWLPSMLEPDFRMDD